MAYINFENGKTALNDTNLNKMQEKIEDSIKGTILYENEEGSQDTITLSENINNFSFIAIVDNFKKVHLYDAANGTIYIETFKMANSVTFRHFCASMDILDNTITLKEQHFYDQNAYQQEYSGLAITKVIGY